MIKTCGRLPLPSYIGTRASQAESVRPDGRSLEGDSAAGLRVKGGFVAGRILSRQRPSQRAGVPPDGRRLRGVNVGRNKQIAMADLRRADMIE